MPECTGSKFWTHGSRQTVFYTPHTLRISEGEKIVGKLTCSPNSRNNRDLDITISYSTPNSERTQVNYKMCALGPRLEGYADQLQVVINRICTVLHFPVIRPIYHLIVSSYCASFFATTGIDIPAVASWSSCIETKSSPVCNNSLSFGARRE